GTTGRMLVGTSLLERNPNPSEEEIRWAISGNICRCTGYMNIVKAIKHAAALREAAKAQPREKAAAAAGGESRWQPKSTCTVASASRSSARRTGGSCVATGYRKASGRE